MRKNQTFQELEKFAFRSLAEKGILAKDITKVLFYQNLTQTVAQYAMEAGDFYSAITGCRKGKLLNPKFYSLAEEVPFYKMPFWSFVKEVREWYKIDLQDIQRKHQRKHLEQNF